LERNKVAAHWLQVTEVPRSLSAVQVVQLEMGTSQEGQVFPLSLRKVPGAQLSQVLLPLLQAVQEGTRTEQTTQALPER
jgi:hypothetical protein